jgi:L-threonylcarbamoyladenylate synthase
LPINRPPPAEIERAATILRAGGLVAFPTETVYGLGACALDERAVARVFEVKGRPRFDPLIVHVAGVGSVAQLVSEFPDAAKRLADRFWPGPLTLVLPKSALVPDLVTAGCPTVAVRVPDHPVALELLRRADIPVAAPSANLFGRISPTTAEHVREQLDDRVDMILDGGACRVGVESTVIEIDGDNASVLRPGGTTIEDLKAVLGDVILPVHSRAKPEGSGLASPGTLPKHYAPHTPLVVAWNGDLVALASRAGIRGERTGGLTPRRSPESIVRDAPLNSGGVLRIGLLTFRGPVDRERFAEFEVLSAAGNLREAAAKFFAALRRLDAARLDLIVAEPFPEEGLGRALNDRLRRAEHS